jgi:hypothetical protein
VACFLTEASRKELKKDIYLLLIVSFPSNVEVIQKGVDKFFPDDADSPDIFCLADSSGVPFDVEDKDTWNLLSTQDYLQANFVYML